MSHQFTEYGVDVILCDIGCMEFDGSGDVAYVVLLGFCCALRVASLPCKL